MDLKAAAQQVKREIAVYRRVVADPRTPRLPKILLGTAIAYLLTPIDLIPDFIPVIGELDDLVIVPGLIWLALRLIPRAVIVEARAVVKGEGLPSDRPREAPLRE